MLLFLRRLLPALLLGLVSALPAKELKVLQVGNGVDPQVLDPQLIVGIPESRIARALGEGLVTKDAAGNIVPGVAKSWTISPDGLWYLFHLRADARWSNGQPLTAYDFVRSFRRLLSPQLGSQNADLCYHIAGAEDFHRGRRADFGAVGIKALDTQVLEFTLRQPVTFFLGLLARPELMPVPVQLIEKLGPVDLPGNRWSRPEHYVGNGPYVLKAWRAGQKVIVARSPTYWDRANVKLDEIHFHPVENPNTEERMFRSGQLHVTQTVPLTKIAAYQRDDPASLHVAPYGGLYYFPMNVKRAPFNDVRVRRALALAIDRQALVRNVTRGGEEPAHHTVRPGLQGYVGRDRFQTDVAAAQRLRAEAGHPGGRGLPPIEFLYNTSENHRVIAEAVQQMWRKHLGVEITLVNQEWKVYLDVLNRTRDFQIARAGWVTDEPHLHLDRWRSDDSSNFCGWGNAEYDRLVWAAQEAKTTEARYALYQQMEDILAAEMPFIPVYFYTLPRLLRPGVTYRTTMDDSFPWKQADVKL